MMTDDWKGGSSLSLIPLFFPHPFWPFYTASTPVLPGIYFSVCVQKQQYISPLLYFNNANSCNQDDLNSEQLINLFVRF